MKKLYKITPYVMLGLMVAGCTDLDTEPLSRLLHLTKRKKLLNLILPDWKPA